MAASKDIPREMTALFYTAPREFSITKRPVPDITDDECLLSVDACGVCGTDAHIHEGEFIAKMPLITGHEVVGTVVKVGKGVSTLKAGDRVVADVGETCGKCYHCIRGSELYCENFSPHGVCQDGGFAEYCTFKAAKLFKINKLTDLEATLLEPASCAVHGLDRLNLKVGSECLLIGAGPTGLILAQLLKLNGASKVTLAANAGKKMQIARQLDAADEYVDLDRKNAKAQWEQLKKDNPYGFDVVVEATGVESIVNDSINYVKRGGTLMVYGVYNDSAKVTWSPNKIFLDEIRVLGSFSQTHCFPAAVAYLESKKVRVDGMVTDVYKIEEYQDALDKMASRDCLKIVISNKHAKK